MGSVSQPSCLWFYRIYQAAPSNSYLLAWTCPGQNLWVYTHLLRWYQISHSVPQCKQPFIVLGYVHMGNITSKSQEAQLPLNKHWLSYFLIHCICFWIKSFSVIKVPVHSAPSFLLLIAMRNIVLLTSWSEITVTAMTEEHYKEQFKKVVFIRGHCWGGMWLVWTRWAYAAGWLSNSGTPSRFIPHCCIFPPVKDKRFLSLWPDLMIITLLSHSHYSCFFFFFKDSGCSSFFLNV